MTRKEILIFQLRECRNEFADALADLSHADLIARPISKRNPIGWIVCHCLNNFDLFLHRGQTNRSVLRNDEEYGALGKYGRNPPGEDNPPPDLSGLAEAAAKVFERCIRVIEGVPEEKFGEKPPYWRRPTFESTAGTCVRVINHSNAHLRQIWMLRRALGDEDHWPVQTLIKDRTRQDGPFIVPDRATILERRRRDAR